MRLISKSRQNKAQSSLELSVSLICAFLLLFASVKIFLWSAKMMVNRQQDYESGSSLNPNTGRAYAGSVGSYDKSVEPIDKPRFEWDFLVKQRYPDLKIFDH